MSEKLFGKISYSLILKVLWAGVLLGLVGFALTFVYVAHTKMPNTTDLENPKFEQSTIVYSADGREIDRYFRKNREWVQFEDLSPYVIDALIATEDHRYFSHSGIDPRGTLRAVAFLGARGGASTITQQLALQFFTKKRSSNFIKRVWQKVKEWVIAVEFERRYTKEEIIAMYLNKFDYTYGSNGIGAASRVYFGKEQKDLSINEAAMLVGMLKSPYYYNPVRDAERAKNRRITVLGQMRKHNYITEEEYQEARNAELDMSKFRRKESYGGMAPYFMAELKKNVRRVLADNGLTKPGGEAYDLDMDGLRIYTTIDTRMQKHAEVAMRKHMKKLQSVYDKSWGSKDEWTHFVDNQKSAPRTKVLNAQIEQSDRYKALRQKHLGKITQIITKAEPKARLWNSDIKRMLRAEKNSKYFDELLSKDYIRTDQREVYETIMSSKAWPVLKKSWGRLNNAVKSAFNTPRSMDVFTMSGYERQQMTPLDSIKHMLSFLQMGSMSMDPHTGHVKTWVGGIDYEHWKYDHVTSDRQVGSTFKPFLYTTALMNSISPCWKVKDQQYTIAAGDGNFGLSKSWSPKNSGEFTNEEFTLKEALKKSLNSASVWLLQQLGTVNGVIQVAENMGVGKGKIPKYPSVIIGTADLTVMEMTAAYSTFANNGVSVEPIVIERIEDSRGVLIYQSVTESHRSLPENTNYAMTELLKNAASNVKWALKTEFGGKTGTTDNHVDGWFMGVTPNLVVGTWVGGEYPWVRFREIKHGQGGYMARPYFLEFMSRVEKDPTLGFDKTATFAVPADMDIELDCSKYDTKPKSEDDVPEFDPDIDY